MLDSNRHLESGRLELRSPSLFTPGAMLILNAYGAILAVPVLIAVVVMSLLPIGYFPLLLPLVGLGLSAIVLPLGLGNPHIARLVRRARGEDASHPGRYIVQITFVPRLRSGFTGVLEDADDFGLLRIDSTSIAFEGDRLSFSLPLPNVSGTRFKNVGLRGLFVYGARVVVSVTGMPGVTEVEFAERSSWLLPRSRRLTGEILQNLELAVRQARQPSLSG